MKTRDFIRVFVIVVMLFIVIACNFQTENGILVISNYSDKNNLEITGVYVKEKNNSGYSLVYTGTILNNESYFIQLEPGEYSVKIEVTNNHYGLFDGKKYYETGYNLYKMTDSYNAISIIFDGKGIYFE